MEQPKHVRAGGSKAHRIIACPASLRLEDEAPAQVSSPESNEGSAAHELLENHLRLCRTDPVTKWLGHPIFIEDDVTRERHKFVVDHEMAEAVQVAVDWVNNILATAPDAKLMIEMPVDWSRLDPPEPMRGTSDIVIHVPSMRLLMVCDYKHGRGHVVEVKGNAQTRFYAVPSRWAIAPEAALALDKIQMTIIQPRAYHPDGPIRSEVITPRELDAWIPVMMQAVHTGRRDDAPAQAGEHCLFCRAASTCPARADHALVVAQDEFFEAPVPAKILDTSEVLAVLARLEPLLESANDWVSSAKAALHARAISGEAIPGFKLVPSKPMRAWNNLDEVRTWAELEMELSPDEYAPRSILSPAQMEKLVGKKKMPTDLATPVSSGLKLVPESAEGKVVRIAASDEFSTED